MKYLKKKLTIENVKVDYIAKKYGTPTYCYSYSELKKNINNFKKSFRSFSPLICFAVKSNTNVNLIKEIKKFGLGADVVSMGELMMAIKAGINPKKIVFSGVGKTFDEIKYAINKNILLINAESESEIKQILKCCSIKGWKSSCILLANSETSNLPNSRYRNIDAPTCFRMTAYTLFANLLSRLFLIRSNTRASRAVFTLLRIV